jgi:hypothetical protein
LFCSSRHVEKMMKNEFKIDIILVRLTILKFCII